MKLINYALIMGMLFLGFYILAMGKEFLLPLVIAIVLWYLIITLSKAFKNIKLGNFKMPRWGAIFLSFVVFYIFFWFLLEIINSNIGGLIKDSEQYQYKFFKIITTVDGFLVKIYEIFHIENPPTLINLVKVINMPAFLSSLGTAFLNFTTTIAKYMGMIFLYLLFLLLEYRTFDKKIDALAATKTGKKNIKSVIQEISKDVNLYLTIKTLASFGTAMLSYFILNIIGLEYAAFWALLIFVLNYIPTIGSIIAVIFPIFFSFIQFDTIFQPILVFIFLLGIQIVIGNVLEPRMQGKSLNLSPLVIILSLVFWGKIWGIVGAFLCVPIMVIINIILSQFPATRPIAILLSANGRIAHNSLKMKTNTE